MRKGPSSIVLCTSTARSTCSKGLTTLRLRVQKSSGVGARGPRAGVSARRGPSDRPQAIFHREIHEFGAALQAYLCHDGSAMGLDRSFGDVQCLCDFSVRVTRGKMLADLAFATG